MMFRYCIKCKCTKQAWESYHKKMRCVECGGTIFLRGYQRD